MAETLELVYDPQNLQQLSQQQITIDVFLNAVFDGNEGRNYIKMCSALKAYHLQNGGAPEVIAFEVVNMKYDIKSLSGSFNCKFKISFFFGCDDLYIDKNDNIAWEFKIDEPSGRVHFKGEEPWEVL